MKKCPEISNFLERYDGWRIRRVDLVRAAHVWAKRPCSFRISNGPTRVIVMRCLFHYEKTPSMHMYINGTFHCYGCGTHLTWLELISELYVPRDAYELISVAKQFVRGAELQLEFDFT